MLVTETIIFFTLVTLTHAGGLVYAKRRQNYPADYRNHLWQLHFSINGLLWLAFIIWLLALHLNLPHSDYPTLYKAAGIVSSIVGLLLVIVAYSALGLKNAMGLRFFLPEKAKQVENRLYQFLNNPMYDGFLLVFLGLGLWLGVVEDFYLAVASFIFLNIFLATIENRGFKSKIF